MENVFTGSDNKTYVLSPLTLGDNKRFVRWVRYRRWTLFQELKDQLPGPTFESESNRILQECNNLDLNEGSEAVTTLEKTVEGITQLVYLSLKHTYPAMTLDQVEEVLTPHIILDVYKRLMIVSGLMTQSKKNETEAKPETESTITNSIGGQANAELLPSNATI